MNLSRRDLLRGLLALPVAATVDWEQLLWIPKPIITVPRMPVVFPLRYYEVAVPIYVEDLKLFIPKDASYSFGFSGFNEADRQKYLPEVPMSEIDQAIKETGQWPRVERQ